MRHSTLSAYEMSNARGATMAHVLADAIVEVRLQTTVADVGISRFAKRPVVMCAIQSVSILRI